MMDHLEAPPMEVQAPPVSAQRIREDTEYLCNVIGDRPTGTEKEAQACDWLEGAL